MREWVELFDKPRPPFRVVTYGHLSVYRVAGLVPARKSYVHCEVEVHTVYQRLLKTLRKAYTQWRSQSAADARAQHGHKPRTQAPPSFQRLAVRKCKSNYGGLGDAPPEKFGIFELPRSILGLL